MSPVGVLGEALVDLAPGPDGVTRALPGGSPANVAVALARLGVTTRFLGRTSSDRYGALIRAHLADAGVELAGPIGQEPTARAVVTLGPDGQPTYEFDWTGTADRTLTEGDVQISGLACLHVGSVSCLLEPGATAIETVVGHQPGGVLISFDPNVRPGFIDAAGRERLLRLASNAHVVKASRDDLELLGRGADLDRAASSLLSDSLTRLVMVTDGEDGAVLYTRRDRVRVAARPPGAVADTVGAGDTFMAGALTALQRADRLSPDALSDLGADDLVTIGRFAAAAASITVSRPGADPPTLDEMAERWCDL